MGSLTPPRARPAGDAVPTVTYVVLELAAIAAVIAVASAIQGLTGFGFALIAIPLLLLVLTPKEAVVVSTLIALGISLWQVGRGYQSIETPVARRMATGLALGMPLGLLFFVSAPENVLQASVGVGVMTAVALTLLRLPSVAANSRVDVAAGVLSGVLKTSVAVNGPPLVLALHLRRLSASSFRATVASILGLSNVVAGAMFGAVGAVGARELSVVGVSLPIVALGLAAGSWVSTRVPTKIFRRLTLSLVAISGALATFSAFLK